MICSTWDVALSSRPGSCKMAGPARRGDGPKKPRTMKRRRKWEPRLLSSLSALWLFPPVRWRVINSESEPTGTMCFVRFHFRLGIILTGNSGLQRQRMPCCHRGGSLDPAMIWLPGCRLRASSKSIRANCVQRTVCFHLAA